jgi:3-oxoacyl-[acyl-carrier protein] reductase
LNERRVAIVTGASRGIGRATAFLLAQAGRHVVVVARKADTLDEVAQQITSAGGSAEVRTCDVGEGEALAALIEEVADTQGRLDIIVNNAGMTRDGLILRMTDDDFDKVLAVNLRSTFVACRAAARPMLRQRFGRIVNIGSVTGIIGNSGQANYAAAKAGLVGFTKSLAKELGPKGITANVVSPGFIATEMTANLGEAITSEAVKAIPMRRFGQPEEIAHVINFICSDEATYISGQEVVVDGGMICT